MDGITHDHSTPRPLTARGQRESLSRRMLGTIALTFYIYVRPVHHPGHPEIRRKPNCHTVVPGMQGFPPCLLENISTLLGPLWTMPNSSQRPKVCLLRSVHLQSCVHALFIHMAALTLERTCGFTKQMPPTLRSYLYTPCRREVLLGRAHLSLQALQQRGNGCSSGIRTGRGSDAAPKPRGTIPST